MIFSKVQISQFNAEYSITDYNNETKLYTVTRDRDNTVVLKDVNLREIHDFIKTL